MNKAILIINFIVFGTTLFSQKNTYLEISLNEAFNQTFTSNRKDYCTLKSIKIDIKYSAEFQKVVRHRSIDLNKIYKDCGFVNSQDWIIGSTEICAVEDNISYWLQLEQSVDLGILHNSSQGDVLTIYGSLICHHKFDTTSSFIIIKQIEKKMNTIEYGIKCNIEDEKILVKNINNYLSQHDYRALYKSEPQGIRNPDSEYDFKYEHYYYQFIKISPRWYFDIYPNMDVNGRARFAKRKDFGWTLYINKVHAENYTTKDHKLIDEFFKGLLDSIEFPTEIIHIYKPNEDRK